MNLPPDQTPGVLHPQTEPPAVPSKRKWQIAGVAILVLLIGAVSWQLIRDTTPETRYSGPVEETGKTGGDRRVTEAPELEVETVLTGLQHVWDVDFLPTNEMIFTERGGTVRLVQDDEARVLADISDVRVRGEGGLMGLAVDPQFADNRYIYTCFNSTKDDIRVVRWRVNDDASALTNRKDIITGMPSNPSGRHSGCQLAFGPDGYLWVGTGDTAQNLTPQSPQSPKSLGGKILRVTRDGAGAPGNLRSAFDSRIYSYGHRNTQGLAFFAEEIDGVAGVSAEHGPGTDDEINVLKPGNFGWAPPDGPYDESVPMTDKDRFPDAVEAIWSSGSPTLAPSGTAILRGDQWKEWDGAVAIAMLKTRHLRILVLDDTLKVVQEEVRLEDEYGRLRAVTQGPDGRLYVSSSNGTDDMILRVIPR